MCGIVGYIGPRQAADLLIEGLRRLEYRGYDSCGVALHQDGVLRRARSTARVAELAANVAADRLQGGTGIAHTHWATHGAANTKVMGGDFVKVLAWYANEWGYSSRCVALLRFMASKGL